MGKKITYGWEFAEQLKAENFEIAEVQTEQEEAASKIMLCSTSSTSSTSTASTAAH
ncbi:hypothetical protein [Auritidibacter sp. NML100628]|uniref:hypothetical protein n=1 Tax=Auritidibacter sp. NML100628 TaxID=2170742 RepID=UPI001304CF28|nr:hypothetical protein [Auritidibacter sp. NML100628]